MLRHLLGGAMSAILKQDLYGIFMTQHLVEQTANSVIPALSTNEPKTNSGRIEFWGRHHDGRFRLRIRGRNILITGAIYALSKGTDHEGNPLWLKLLLDMTPGYRVQKSDELSFDVICAKTNARMAVMGQLVRCLKNSKHGEIHNV